MVCLRNLLVPLLSLSSALAASLQQVTNFGSNPTGATMFIYVPDKLSSPPGLLVAIHYCSGTAQAYFSGSQYANRANSLGFVVVYPDAPDAGGCWDVHTNATFTHDAGGDSLGIASMTRYAIKTYSVDPNRVFVTGTSSGAMMTNVLLGAYPDLYKGGAAFAGVPYACFGGASMWNSACANGQSTKTGQQWGDLVRSGYPGFSGTRPKMQLWHGTADTTLNYNNFKEEIKQWTNVFGVSETPTVTTQNSPVSGYTKTVYGSAGQLEAYSGSGVDHNIPLREDMVLAFFGLNQAPTPGGTTTTTPTTPTTTPTTPTTTPTTSPTAPPVGTAPHWGQCGGQGWSGATACESPFVCTAANQWYSQCL